MIETVGDMVKTVLTVSGIVGTGQTALAEDSNTCLDWMRMLLAQWGRKRWLIWNLPEASVVSTGATWYTIGPGGDFDVPRPDKLHAAWFRFQPFDGPNALDIPVAIIEAKEDYAKIAIKDLHSIPSAVFYDSSFPIGRITFYPVPPAAHYELHIVTKAALPDYTSLTQPLNLPEEYHEALLWSLVVRMSMSYGLPANPSHVGAMKTSINTIEMANSQIGLLSMPSGLVRGGGDVSSWSGKGLDRAWVVSGPSVLS